MLSLLPLLLAPGPRYYTFSLNGHRTGYLIQEERADVYGGKPAVRQTGHAENFGNYGGTVQKSTIDVVLWATPDDRPLRETVTAKTMGRVVRIDSVFGPKAVTVETDADGTKSRSSVPLPDGPVYVDDATVVRHRLKPGGSLVYWTKGVGSNEFTKTTLRCVGPAVLELEGKRVSATLTEDLSEGETSKLYTSPEGDLLRMENADGSVLQSASRAVALAAPDAPTPDTDVLALNSLKIEGLPDDLSDLRELKLRGVGEDFSGIPSDETQTVTKDGDGWIVDLHPMSLQITSGEPVAGTEKGKEAWTRPSAFVSSNDPKIQAAVKAYRDPRARFPDVVQGVRAFVAKRMTYRIEMGPWRDAAEILRRPNGKCTEYAVLTTALLRAAGVPARVAIGLVPGGDGALYYHAWTEAWDGTYWFGVDSTGADGGVFPAVYLKLSHGNPDEIKQVMPPNPKKVKFTVLDSARWAGR